VYVFAAFWQGCSREFGQHADRLRNGLHMPVQTRPARETTTQASPCKEKQRSQGAAKACNHTRSALTERVISQTAKIFNLIRRILIAISGQLRILGSSVLRRLAAPERVQVAHRVFVVALKRLTFAQRFGMVVRSLTLAPELFVHRGYTFARS